MVMENLNHLTTISPDNFFGDFYSIIDIERNSEKVKLVRLTYANGMTFEVEIKTYKLEDSKHHQELFYVYINEFTNFKSKYFIDFDNALNFAKEFIFARSKSYTEFLKRKSERKK